jgi:hypothetical protein
VVNCRKRIERVFLLSLLLLLASFQVRGQEAPEECTAGVASGIATVDGRPLLWKTRDGGGASNEVTWNTSGRYHFVSVVSSPTPMVSWMGLNERGFAIINTASGDLADTVMAQPGRENGTFMTRALQECATVEEFEALLKATNERGRHTAANFGVIDATGAAAFFETGAYSYWRYDASGSEKGYLLRSNFAIHGRRGLHERPSSMDRYLQTERLMLDFFATERIDFKEIVRIQARSFGNPQGDIVPLPITKSVGGHPPGYYPHNASINRNSTVSFAIIRGVLPGEDPRLSTMWTILGQPSSGVIVPYWPVGPTPPEADGPRTAPLADASERIRAELYESLPEPASGSPGGRPLFINTLALQDEHGEGIWSVMFPAEDSIIAETERELAIWRATGLDVEAMLKTERQMASRALRTLERAYAYLLKRR